MVIDSTIIERYLQGESAEDLKDHWIFNRIVEGETLFEMPPEEKRNLIQTVYTQIMDTLKCFKPRNNPLFEAIFPKIDTAEAEEIYVYIIIGAPNPYDAICRTDKSGKLCVIFDLVRIASYCDNVKEIQGLMENLITHELTHIYLCHDYPAGNYMSNFENHLKYIVFNEGFAHYLSISDNVLAYDFEKYRDKWKSAVVELKKSFETHTNDQPVALSNANTGPFWDKFGTISGMFGIYKYINGSANPYQKFVELYAKGPQFLTDYIIKGVE